jgi:hypothetical protein
VIKINFGGTTMYEIMLWENTEIRASGDGIYHIEEFEALEEAVRVCRRFGRNYECAEVHINDGEWIFWAGWGEEDYFEEWASSEWKNLYEKSVRTNR